MYLMSSNPHQLIFPHPDYTVSRLHEVLRSWLTMAEHSCKVGGMYIPCRAIFNESKRSSNDKQKSSQAQL